jgi:hypothetical protein
VQKGSCPVSSTGTSNEELYPRSCCILHTSIFLWHNEENVFLYPYLCYYCINYYCYLVNLHSTKDQGLVGFGPPMCSAFPKVKHLSHLHAMPIIVVVM